MLAEMKVSWQILSGEAFDFKGKVHYKDMRELVLMIGNDRLLNNVAVRYCY